MFSCEGASTTKDTKSAKFRNLRIRNLRGIQRSHFIVNADVSSYPLQILFAYFAFFAVNQSVSNHGRRQRRPSRCKKSSASFGPQEPAS